MLSLFRSAIRGRYGCLFVFEISQRLTLLWRGGPMCDVEHLVSVMAAVARKQARDLPPIRGTLSRELPTPLSAEETSKFSWSQLQNLSEQNGLAHPDNSYHIVPDECCRIRP